MSEKMCVCVNGRGEEKVQVRAFVHIEYWAFTSLLPAAEMRMYLGASCQAAEEIFLSTWTQLYAYSVRHSICLALEADNGLD